MYISQWSVTAEYCYIPAKEGGIADPVASITQRSQQKLTQDSVISIPTSRNKLSIAKTKENILHLSTVWGETGLGEGVSSLIRSVWWFFFFQGKGRHSMLSKHQLTGHGSLHVQHECQSVLLKSSSPRKPDRVPLFHSTDRCLPKTNMSSYNGTRLRELTGSLVHYAMDLRIEPLEERMYPIP